MVTLDNKFAFSNCEKYIVAWDEKICWATCFQFYSPNIRLQKGKFSRHRTLYTIVTHVYVTSHVYTIKVCVKMIQPFFSFLFCCTLSTPIIEYL